MSSSASTDKQDDTIDGFKDSTSPLASSPPTSSDETSTEMAGLASTVTPANVAPEIINDAEKAKTFVNTSNFIYLNPPHFLP